MVHNSVRLETSAIGVERIKEYTEKETEVRYTNDKMDVLSDMKTFVLQ